MKLRHCSRMSRGIGLFLAPLLVFHVCMAAQKPACDQELRALVVPPLKGVAMDKKDIQAEPEEHRDGVYSIRLFVPARNADNLDGQVSIGWVDLDVDSMKAFDVTNDPNNRAEMSLDRAKLARYVKNCLGAGRRSR